MTEKRYLIVLVLAMLLGSVHALWGHQGQGGTIGPAELARMIEKQPASFKLLDVRTEAAYIQGHIEKARILPLREISENRLSQLGLEKNDAIIVYANSDPTSRKAKTLMGLFGFRQVTILSGGFTHWQEDGYPVTTGKMRGGLTEQTSTVTTSLRLAPESHDFGLIPQKGGLVNTRFTVSNTGKEEILITEISTSCGCTTASLSDKTIQPGQSITLTVYFNPDYHKEPLGRFSRTVFLQTSESLELQAKIYVEIQMKE